MSTSNPTKDSYPHCDIKRCRQPATTIIWWKEPRRRLQICGKHATVTISKAPVNGDVTWAEIYA